MSILKFLLGHLSTAATVRPTRMQHPKLFENRTPRSTEREVRKNFSFFCVCWAWTTVRPRAGVGQSVAVWQTYLWSAIIAIAISCLCLIIVFENEFSVLISQSQQSTIVIAFLRSAQTCGDRSSPAVGKSSVVECWC